MVWLSALLTQAGRQAGRHPNCGPGALEGIISLLPAELANHLVPSGHSKCHMGECFIPQLAPGGGNVIWGSEQTLNPADTGARGWGHGSSGSSWEPSPGQWPAQKASSAHRVLAAPKFPGPWVGVRNHRDVGYDCCQHLLAPSLVPLFSLLEALPVLSVACSASTSCTFMELSPKG